jgi:hypothetical protein
VDENRGGANGFYGTGVSRVTVNTITGLTDLAVGDIIYLSAPQAAPAGAAQLADSKIAAALTEAMLIVDIVRTAAATADLYLERGVLGTTIANINNAAALAIYKRYSDLGQFPGVPSASATSPAKLHRDASGVHTAHNQVRGNIQTTGVRMPRGGPRRTALDAAGATLADTTAGANDGSVAGAAQTVAGQSGAVVAADVNAKGAKLDSAVDVSNHNYGFDGDFRLYSVLGPFMRPAVIRDVIDTSMMSKAARTSNFPGVLTIHEGGDYKSALKASDLVDTGINTDGNVNAAYGHQTVLALAGLGNELEYGDLIMVSASPAAALRANGEIMMVVQINSPTQIVVRRGQLGTPVLALAGAALNVYKLPAREMSSNNAKYSLAPIDGTSFAAANSRATQYHTYAGTDRIISFCNPLQGDLNNAPGSVIMSAISDDPVSEHDDLAGTSAMNGWASVHGAAAADTVVNNQATRSSVSDGTFASSNGKESTAPSMWTVPRRHHLCRKLVTGTPDIASNDVAVDPYVIANNRYVSQVDIYSAVFARSRYTESVQMNQVLNQDPSPNMRAMVTFMEPTTIAVSTACQSCEYSAASFKASMVNPSCASFTIKTETFSVTFPANFPSIETVTLAEEKFAGYTVAEAAAGGEVGVDTYNKKSFLGNFGVIGGIPDTNTAEFTIKQTVAGVDTSARRRLLADCPDGFDARMLRVGAALKTACGCPSVCGKAESECSTSEAGAWNTVSLVERVCKAAASPYDPTPAIVGGVLGGFFGLLLIGLLIWYLCCRKPAPEPVGRAVAIEKPLAPVYLPQPYPTLPEQYVPQPVPVLDATTSIVQPTGQPMLYSSFQGVPVMEAYPAQPGSYPAPYGVAPQAAYGI